MTWFKVDDGLHSHPKWTAASLAARGLWATAGSWCADQLTDGFVPQHMVRLFGARPRDAAELVRLHLWEDGEGGWQFHNWGEYQPTSESVEAERAAARDRQRRARERSRESRRNARSDVSRDSDRDSRREFGPPDPTRPITARGDARTYDPPDGSPPPRRCPEHQDVTHSPPCGACADARLAHNAWQARQQANSQRTPDGERFLPGSGRLSGPSPEPDPATAEPDWAWLRDKVRHPNRPQENP